VTKNKTSLRGAAISNIRGNHSKRRLYPRQNTEIQISPFRANLFTQHSCCNERFK